MAIRRIHITTEADMSDTTLPTGRDELRVSIEHKPYGMNQDIRQLVRECAERNEQRALLEQRRQRATELAGLERRRKR